ncbi:MAG: hypothetical protein GC208_10325 [Alphaproteobacteria bacterium]|nr:hypothetical protein [Alphaproteobacteria bacterium]
MTEYQIALAELPNAIVADMAEHTRRVHHVLRRTADRCHAHIVGLTQERISDTTGVFAASYEIDEQPGSVTLYNSAPHAEFVEEGTRPRSKMPPLLPILLWLSRKRNASAVISGKPVLKGVPASIKRSSKWDLSDQESFSTTGKKGRSAARAAELEGLRQHAVAIARSIKEKGTRPHRLMASAQPTFEAIFDEELRGLAQ